MCLYVLLYWQNGSICDCMHVFWSFIHVSFVCTQCGFFALCVANFSILFADFLLMLYIALCVLCVSYIKYNNVY